MALNQNNQNNSPKRKKKGFGLGWLYILMLVAITGILFFPEGKGGDEVEWSRFQAMFQEDLFEEVTVYSSKGTVHAVVKKEAEAKAKKYQVANNNKEQVRPSLLSKVEVTSEIPGAGAFNDLYQEIMAGKKPISAKVSYVNSTTNLLNIIMSFLPLIIIIFFWVWMSRRMMGNMGGGSGGSGGIFNVGKSKAQLFDAENKVKVTFKDVA
ncbi:ATP-dependent metallopeptidase FtsH/Yme1/Tma family protein, partial [uncultured Porphyromonas sp.]|uniref:ATP-dependent metallopeptidase FtsH/Yme1/Tma family protein n=1 Tax=uncultured Porphyromonas sp. TaxID=159274 RepID=UPI0034143480